MRSGVSEWMRGRKSRGRQRNEPSTTEAICLLLWTALLPDLSRPFRGPTPDEEGILSRSARCPYSSSSSSLGELVWWEWRGEEKGPAAPVTVLCGQTLRCAAAG